MRDRRQPTALVEPAGDGTPVANGIMLLIERDPNATWNEATRAVQGSCGPGCAPTSPRIVSVPMYDPDEYQLAFATNQLTTLKVVKILHYFVANTSWRRDQISEPYTALSRRPSVAVEAKTGYIGVKKRFLMRMF